MHYEKAHGRILVAAIGSMTAAVKAQRALLAVGIPSEVIALSPRETRRGCAWGVEFPYVLEQEARAALRAARVLVSQYIEKRDRPT